MKKNDLIEYLTLGNSVPSAYTDSNHEMEYPCQCERLFNAAWRLAAEHGMCDEWGGVEYYRIKRAWYAAGRPFNAIALISREANRQP